MQQIRLVEARKRHQDLTREANFADLDLRNTLAEALHAITGGAITAKEALLLARCGCPWATEAEAEIREAEYHARYGEA